MSKWSARWHDRLLFTVGRFPVLTVLGLCITGVVFWGGFNTLMEATNTESFCITCHEMRDNVYPKYKRSIHYMNTSGVRASCPDCHVPKDWAHKFVRKVTATKELYHHVTGSIDTVEKFRDKHLYLAQKVWKTMQETNSRECRNCHEMSQMDMAKQPRKSAIFHEHAQEKGKTCIDCHKGIAHQLPNGYVDEALEKELDEMHVVFEERKEKCHVCHEGMAHSEW